MTEQNKPKLVDELRTMEVEPLLPVEKKLILYSVILGVGLLIALAWVSATFFEVRQEIDTRESTRSVAPPSPGRSPARRRSG